MEYHEMQALKFLSKGPDCISNLDCEENIAALMVYNDLRRDGFLLSRDTDSGTEFSLSDLGIEELLKARNLDLPSP